MHFNISTNVRITSQATFNAFSVLEPNIHTFAPSIFKSAVGFGEPAESQFTVMNDLDIWQMRNYYIRPLR
jgi:hypothetical protein